jgi:NADPH-dependent 2,4-dienoyl-CoA reductase/sulfur reductase-like enzyme
VVGERVVVVGADAAGMSAAHQALRTARARGGELEVVVLERTGHTSYSACGIPYWIAGDVENGDQLVARTAEQHRALGVDLRLGTAAVSLDLAAGTVTAVGADGGAERLGYDQLVLATGAHPRVPDWALGPDAGSPASEPSRRSTTAPLGWRSWVGTPGPDARWWSAAGTSASRPRRRSSGAASPRRW